MHRALDAGINFIDTADVYSQGESEEIVGKALAGPARRRRARDQVPRRDGRRPNRRQLAALDRRAVEESLRRLGTDWIDLYQVHRPDPDTDIDETLGALTDLVQPGKIRYSAPRRSRPHELVEAQWVADRRGLQRPHTEQPPYSLLVRGLEADVLPVCQRYGMGVIPWARSPGAGYPGRYRMGQDAPAGVARGPASRSGSTCAAGEPAQAGRRRRSWRGSPRTRA